MTLKRETIVLASAIVGVNIVGMATYSTAANSSGLCDGFTQMWHGTATRQAEPAKGKPIGGYFDVSEKQDRPYYREGEAPKVPHIRQNGAWVEPQNANQDTGRLQTPARNNPLTTPYPPQLPTRTQTLPPAPGAFTPISSSSFLGGESESAYQQRRRAIAQQGGY